MDLLKAKSQELKHAWVEEGRGSPFHSREKKFLRRVARFHLKAEVKSNFENEFSFEEVLFEREQVELNKQSWLIIENHFVNYGVCF